MFLLESNSNEKSQTTEWKLLVFSTNILPFMQLPIQDHFSKQQRCRRSRIYLQTWRCEMYWIWYVMIINLNMDQSTTCLHLVLSFFYAGFSTWTCARRCARCTQLQWWEDNWVFWIFDDVYGLQVAWLVVDLYNQLVGYKWWQVKSEFHRHVSVSQNGGLKDPVKIWQ